MNPSKNTSQGDSMAKTLKSPDTVGEYWVLLDELAQCPPLIAEWNGGFHYKGKPDHPIHFTKIVRWVGPIKYGEDSQPNEIQPNEWVEWRPYRTERQTKSIFRVLNPSKISSPQSSTSSSVVPGVVTQESDGSISDLELTRLVAAWPCLPKHIKSTIGALVGTTAPGG